MHQDGTNTDPVSLQDLKNYQHLTATIRGLEQEISAIYVASPPKTERGGRSNVRHAGDPTRKKAMLILKKRERLEEKLTELTELAERIDQFLDTVKEPHIAQIIRLHYIDGITWSKTCMIMYKTADPDYCRKMVKAYFRKLSDFSDS